MINWKFTLCSASFSMKKKRKKSSILILLGQGSESIKFTRFDVSGTMALEEVFWWKKSRSVFWLRLSPLPLFHSPLQLSLSSSSLPLSFSSSPPLSLFPSPSPLSPFLSFETVSVSHGNARSHASPRIRVQGCAVLTHFKVRLEMLYKATELQSYEIINTWIIANCVYVDKLHNFFRLFGFSWECRSTTSGYNWCILR